MNKRTTIILAVGVAMILAAISLLGLLWSPTHFVSQFLGLIVALAILIGFGLVLLYTGVILKPKSTTSYSTTPQTDSHHTATLTSRTAPDPSDIMKAANQNTKEKSLLETTPLQKIQSDHT
jgi:hypothetical protein